MTGTENESKVTYEELAELEKDFDDVDVQLLKQQYKLSKPLYEKRQALVSQIPHFWSSVLEMAPQEIDQFIQPSDSNLFANALKSISIDRFEIDDPNGSPRSFAMTFEFEPNEHFEDRVLEKKFWFRRAEENWTGLISEPVKINWKDGGDLTNGITDAAVAYWEVRKQKGDAAKDSKEAEKLSDLLEECNAESVSFFTLFSFVSSRKYITAEESAEANAAEAERRAKRAKGEKAEDPADKIENYDQGLEVHPSGEELATVIAEDLWPSAIRYFTSAQEAEHLEFDDSDMEIEEIDEESEDEEDARVNLQKLGEELKKGRSERDGPPSKKRKA
ncbi:hypothetical protein M501DRAFT_1000351 [Patellaria atrata CBS 101060]|uniref:Nap family protein n=1 Tax=Patellaria atrata CBS 101060 TaxID=1346257 RepID=A0A9P4SER6_9PEZI|nr:hypothetical protein M501DRAFT_1000351 [Patellaria atrata CBS 101060]